MGRRAGPSPKRGPMNDWLHNLSVPGQSVDKDVAPGQTIAVRVKVTGAAVPYFCKYHRAAGMVGALLPGQS